jgi:flagellar basal-body rod protein FlgB
MSEIYLLSLAAQQRDWLSTRQAAIAMNVANAATPGYRSADVPSFDAIMKEAPISLAATHANHISSRGGFSPDKSAARQASWEISHSGNSVSLEQEMLKAGQVSRAFSMNVNMTRAFHDMLLSGLRG